MYSLHICHLLLVAIRICAGYNVPVPAGLETRGNSATITSLNSIDEADALEDDTQRGTRASWAVQTLPSSWQLHIGKQCGE